MLVGERLDGVDRFLGIPYARPPVDQLRWQEPAVVEAWPGERDAVAFGSAAMQPMLPGVDLGARPSEDCLYLNVWTEALDVGDARPVMVWIHGGGFFAGAASEPLYDGQAFAKSGVVLVTVNYRLGAFGFLAHPEVPENLGLLDQLAALRWVQENIAAFGGDPERVTVFGESAGAAAIAHLLRLPQSQGLLQGAILQSGGVDPPASGEVLSPTRAEARAVTQALFDALGVSDLAAARTAEAGRVLGESMRLMFGDHGRRYATPWDLAIGPVVDGLGDPDRRLARVVPVLLGCNANEARFFARPHVGFTVEELQDLARLVGSDVSFEPETISVDETYALLDEVFTRGFFLQPTLALAEAYHACGAPTFLYHFRRLSPSARAGQMLASHMAEIPYVFGTLPPDGFDEDDRALSHRMREAWVTFARTGTPDPAGQTWPAYPQVAVFDDRLTIETMPAEATAG
jgi:para-nitrobenzyl esterase